MVSINLPEDVVAHLDEIARRENRNVAQIVETMLNQYDPKNSEDLKQIGDWSLILGISDAEIDDMSTSVRETLADFYQQKYGNSDWYQLFTSSNFR